MNTQKILVVTIFLSVIVTARKLATVSPENSPLPPPPPSYAAQMARYIVHNSEWTSVATISATEPIKGYPFVGLKSLADGPDNNGTGIPYMMMTDMDISMNDLNHDSRCTLFMTLAEGNFCKTKNYDPQDPRCARVMLTGNIKKLQKNSDEEIFAKNALYTKHPEMSMWPIDHRFFIAKLNISQVLVLDFFGGIKHVSVEEYFKSNLSNIVPDDIVKDVRVIQVNII